MNGGQAFLRAVVAVTVAACLLLAVGRAAVAMEEHSVSYLGALVIVLVGVGIALIAFGLWPTNGGPGAKPKAPDAATPQQDSHQATGKANVTSGLVAAGIVLLLVAVPCVWKLADAPPNEVSCTLETRADEASADTAVRCDVNAKVPRRLSRTD